MEDKFWNFITMLNVKPDRPIHSEDIERLPLKIAESFKLVEIRQYEKSYHKLEKALSSKWFHGSENDEILSNISFIIASGKSTYYYALNEKHKKNVEKLIDKIKHNLKEPDLSLAYIFDSFNSMTDALGINPELIGTEAYPKDFSLSKKRVMVDIDVRKNPEAKNDDDNFMVIYPNMFNNFKIGTHFFTFKHMQFIKKQGDLLLKFNMVCNKNITKGVLYVLYEYLMNKFDGHQVNINY